MPAAGRRSTWARSWIAGTIARFSPTSPIAWLTRAARSREVLWSRSVRAKAAEAARNLDLTASWVVGDRPEDIGLAQAVGHRRSTWDLTTASARVPGVSRALLLRSRSSWRASPYEFRPRLPILRATGRQHPGQVPDRAVRERREIFGRVREEDRPGPRTQSNPPRSIARRRSSLTPTRAAPECSRAAMAVRPRSRTTCNATT